MIWQFEKESYSTLEKADTAASSQPAAVQTDDQLYIYYVRFYVC